MTCSQCGQDVQVVAVDFDATGFQVLAQHKAPCGRECAGGKGTRKKRHRANACSRCLYVAHKEVCAVPAPAFCGECNHLAGGARP